MACINPNSPEFKEILSKVNNPLLAEIEMDKGITPITQEIPGSTNNTFPSRVISDFSERVKNFFSNQGFEINYDELKNYPDFINIERGIDLIQKAVYLPSTNTVPEKEAVILGLHLLKKTVEVVNLKNNIKAWDKYTELKNKHIRSLKSNGYYGDKMMDTAEMYVLYDFVTNYFLPIYDKTLSANKTEYKSNNDDDSWVINNLKNLVKLFTKLLKKFKILKPSYEAAELSAKKIVADILNNNINYNIPQNYELKSDTIYNPTLQEMRGKIKAIGLVETGSSTLRLLGDVYRAKDEIVNDIDSILPYESTFNLLGINEIELKSMSEEDYIALISSKISNLLGKDFTLVRAFVGKEHKGNKTASLTFTYKGEKLDVFVRTHKSFKNEFENDARIIESILTNKLSMARAKDIIDYKYFRPKTELQLLKRNPAVQVFKKLSLDEDFKMKQEKTIEFFDMLKVLQEYGEDNYYNNEIMESYNNRLMNKIEKNTSKEYRDYIERILNRYITNYPEKYSKGIKLKRVFSAMIPIALKNGIISDIDFIEEKVDSKLDEYLIQWLNNYGVEIKSLKEYAIEQGISLSGAVDVINKIVYLANSEDRSVNTLAKDVSTMMLFMIGKKGYPGSGAHLVANGLKAITSYPKYNKLFLEYSKLDRYKQLNEHGVLVPNIDKINYEILSIALSERLVIKHKARTNTDTFWNKIDDIINWIVNLFVNKNFISLDAVTDKLANDILKSKSEYIPEKPDSYILKSYEQTLEDNPILVKALDVTFELKGTPTGSLSYRNQLDTYRDINESIHDLDIIFKFEDYKSIDDIISEYIKRLPNTFIPKFINPVTREEGDKKWIDTYTVDATLYHGGELLGKLVSEGGDLEIVMTVDGKEVPHTVRNINTDEVYKETGRDANGNVYHNGLLIDIFLERSPTITYVDNKKLSHYVESFEQKLRFGRPKDSLDLVLAKNRRNVEPVNNDYIFYNIAPKNTTNDNQNKSVIQETISGLSEPKRSFVDYSDFGKTLSKQEIINLKKQGNKVTAKQFLESIVPTNDFEEKLKGFLLSINLSKLNNFDFVINDEYQGNIIGLNERELFEKPTVIFNSKTTNQPARYKLHEFLHSLLDIIVNEEQEFRDELISLFEYVKTLPEFKNEYGVIGWWEFYTEGMTNPDFQTKLKNVTLSGYKGGKKSSVYEEFVKIINSFLEKLGFVNKDYSALDEIINSTTKVIEKRYGYNTKQNVQDLFETDVELADKVYSALDYNQNIIQDNNSYYRGQLGEPTLDTNGNLILYPESAEWQQKLTDTDKGVSLSTQLLDAEHYGSWRFEQRSNQIMEEFLSEYDQNNELEQLEETGYTLIQIDKDVMDSMEKVQGKENEDRIITDTKITIPKGKFKIERFNSEGKIVDVTKQQQAIEIYSQYLQSLNKSDTNPILQDNQSVITSNDKIIFGHPGIGKTFAKKSNDFIDVDEDYKKEHTMQKALRNHAKTTGKEEDLKVWEDYITDWWTKVKSDAIKSGKQIFVSNLPILRLFPQDFDKVITISEETFVNRAKQRNDYIQGDTEDWKNSLDIEIAKIDKSKVVTTDKYLSDLFDNTKQEQVKKFVELQERLNNKEFVEGAKNVYDNSKELQELGTQEQYVSYIAKVVLGIVRNPSSGEFNNSKVTDVVYHGTGKYNEEEILLNGFDSTLQGENKVIFFTGDINQSFSRLGGTINAIVNIEQLFNNRFTSLLNKANENSNSFYYPTEEDVNSSLYEIIKKRNPGNIFIDNYGKTAEVTVISSDQIHILSSKQDTEGFKKHVSTVDNKHLNNVKNAIRDNLPVEISSAITVVNEVPIEILGRDDLYLSIKEFLIDNGIEDEVLINWVGINKDRFGHPKNIKSTEQLLSIINKRYDELKNINNHPELKRNTLALDSFNKWVIALERYPIAFREVMLTHAVKYLNPLRRAKYVLQLSDVALMQTYGILVGKPHELNRIGKLYDKEVVATLSDAVEHEPSASGKGYWVHIPRTIGTYREQTNKNKLQLLIQDIENQKQKLIQDREQSKEKDKDFYTRQVAKLEIEKNLIESYITEKGLSKIYSIPDTSSIDVTEDNILEKSDYYETKLSDRYKKYRNALVVDLSNINERLNKYKAKLEEVIYEHKLKQKLNLFNEEIAALVQEIEELDVILNSSQYNTNVELLRKLSPSRWCTASGAAYTYVQDYDNYLLIINGITVVGIEVGKVGDNGKIQVEEVTSRANNGIASIDHYDDTYAFFVKHNLDTDNESLQIAFAAKSAGKTDAQIFKKSAGEEIDEDYYNLIDEQESRLKELQEDATKVNTIQDAITFISELPRDFYSVTADIKPEIKNNEEVSNFIVKVDSNNISIIDRELPFYKELAHKAVMDNAQNYGHISMEARQDPRNIALHEIYLESRKLMLEDDLPFSKTNQNLIQGYYDVNTDKVVVVASNISVEEAPRIAIHEVAHRGIVRMAKDLGGIEELSQILFAAENQLMEKLPILLNRTGHKSLESLMLDYGFTTDSREGKVKLLMELCARWAETLVDKPKPTWWRELISNVRNWITKFTGKTLSETEVNELVGGFVRYGTQQDNENTYYQKTTDIASPFEQMSKTDQVAFEKTVRDLAARMSDRIGIPYKIINNVNAKYKGKLSNGIAYINLAYCDMSTISHEVLGHSIIRALKNKSELSFKEQLNKEVYQGNIEKKC